MMGLVSAENVPKCQSSQSSNQPRELSASSLTHNVEKVRSCCVQLSQRQHNTHEELCCYGDVIFIMQWLVCPQVTQHLLQRAGCVSVRSSFTCSRCAGVCAASALLLNALTNASSKHPCQVGRISSWTNTLSMKHDFDFKSYAFILTQISDSNQQVVHMLGWIDSPILPGVSAIWTESAVISDTPSKT